MDRKMKLLMRTDISGVTFEMGDVVMVTEQECEIIKNLKAGEDFFDDNFDVMPKKK